MSDRDLLMRRLEQGQPSVTGPSRIPLDPPHHVLVDRVVAEALRAAGVQPETDQAVADAAWGSVWLHGRWSWLTKNMTTPEREYAADCVARWSAALNADDPNLEPGEPEGLRWWREANPGD